MAVDLGAVPLDLIQLVCDLMLVALSVRNVEAGADGPDYLAGRIEERKGVEQDIQLRAVGVSLDYLQVLYALTAKDARFARFRCDAIFRPHNRFE